MTIVIKIMEGKSQGKTETYIGYFDENDYADVSLGEGDNQYWNTNDWRAMTLNYYLKKEKEA